MKELQYHDKAKNIWLIECQAKQRSPNTPQQQDRLNEIYKNEMDQYTKSKI